MSARTTRVAREAVGCRLKAEGQTVFESSQVATFTMFAEMRQIQFYLQPSVLSLQPAMSPEAT
jgi:hypothetical protein